MKAWLDRFLFAPSSPIGLIATRSILAAQALWIVVSRPGLAELTAWPNVFWERSSRLHLRFAIIPGAPTADHALYVILIAALTAALLGIVPRLGSLISALLLYHFTPMEAIVGNLPYTASLSGLTLPLMGLLLIAFSAAPHLGSEWSPDYRWPVVLIQIIFVFHYVTSGLAKLHFAGLRWYSTENIGHLAVALWMLQAPRLSLLVWQRTWLATAIGIGAFIVEFGFPLILFSKWARRILLPLAFLAFVLRIYVFGFFFLSFPSLLVMLNWDAIALWWQRKRSPQST